MSFLLNAYASQNGFWPWLFTKLDSDFPIFLRIGSLEIRWYAVCILTGAILCLVRCRYELKKRGMPEDYYDNFFLSVIPLSIIGARVWYVVSNPKDFNSFAEMCGFTNGQFSLSGLAIQGGVLTGLIWGCIYFKCIKKRYPLGLHVDLIIPSVFIGQILGRWGNFFNGEVYGKEVSRSSLWFIPKWIINNCTTGTIGSQAGDTMVHLPLFFIEGCINLVGYVLIGYVAWRFWKKFRKPYQVGCLYFIYYGVVRLSLENLRVSQYNMTNNALGINTSILMSILFIVVGVAMFIFLEIYYRKVPYEKIYINEAAEELERKQKEEHDAKLQAMIDAKKAEIRARKKAEQEQSNNQ